MTRSAEAILAGNREGLTYAGARFAREDALEALIVDAAGSCKATTSGPPPDPG
ncbi:hypothetical protein [Phenylobacterium sp.]|uniref:hypothetical protein n=1 Tax=Phenylobacterium sp. TaxID=1871053 RepID=UPI0027307CC2|nr:hypothetical protein [Phenylobacterium sp.]MDP2214988.1 hypothetical protein [Phenylobacterium sp.]